jgi:phosphoribosylglycinamide formyltransferase-1
MLTNPLRVAVLCSSRAPGLADLLERDPARGRAYDVVTVITSESAFAEQELARRCGAAVVYHPIDRFYGGRVRSIDRVRATRSLYDFESLRLLESCSPDLVLLNGYVYVITNPLLDGFPNRILNLHFSDLTIRHADGRPVFVGKRAVRDAIVAGEKETAATVHLVNELPDGGAPIVRSWPHAVSPVAAFARQWHLEEMLKAYVFAHQEWMIRDAAGPVLKAALHLIAGRAIDLDALGAQNPAKVLPWVVDDRGRLSPPESVHLFERLWAYEHACAETGSRSRGRTRDPSLALQGQG